MPECKNVDNDSIISEPGTLHFMSTSIIICDDSSFARKQVTRALPPEWQTTVTYASNGAEGLDAVRQKQGELMFLDLTMPVMDGYRVLETIKREDLPILVIVISGDVQPEAFERVKKLGAIDFIKKPVNPDNLKQVLIQYGLL